MRIALLLLCLTILSACTFPFPQSMHSQDEKHISQMLLQGVHDLSQKNSTSTLKKLIKQHPESSQAVTAKKLLDLVSKGAQGKSSGTSDLDKLRKENQRLQEDLEELRQLLIKSEKRAN